jgi:hypothetical protein
VTACAEMLAKRCNTVKACQSFALDWLPAKKQFWSELYSIRGGESRNAAWSCSVPPFAKLLSIPTRSQNAVGVSSLYAQPAARPASTTRPTGPPKFGATRRDPRQRLSSGVVVRLELSFVWSLVWQLWSGYLAS